MLRDKIKELNDKTKVSYHVPEWDVDLWFHSLSVREYLEIQHANETVGGTAAWSAFVVAHYAKDEEGNRHFQDDDVEWLKEKNADVVGPLSAWILRSTGIFKLPEQVEDGEKN